jgi:Flp pilus assembly pilin Flp
LLLPLYGVSLCTMKSESRHRFAIAAPKDHAVFNQQIGTGRELIATASARPATLRSRSQGVFAPKRFCLGGGAKGQTMSEYALLLAGVAVITIGAYRQFGVRSDIVAVQVGMKLNGASLPVGP